MADALAHYDKSFSGWGNFTFFIGLLPTAYTFAAIGMITSMAEEVADPARDVPKALSLVVPISAVAGLFFILPICFTVSRPTPVAKLPSSLLAFAGAKTLAVCDVGKQAKPCLV